MARRIRAPKRHNLQKSLGFGILPRESPLPDIAHCPRWLGETVNLGPATPIVASLAARKSPSGLAYRSYVIKRGCETG